MAGTVWSLLWCACYLHLVHGWLILFPSMFTREENSGGDRSSWLIFPGTKWCGSGNISESYDDLGVNRETDACCREHDYCPDLIEAGGTGHGLTNGALYTRLNCECDQKFYDCLMKVGDLSSKQVGVTYFDVLNTQCFREDYPIRSCKRYSPIVRKRCLEYEFDEESPKQWQWFDVPFF